MGLLPGVTPGAASAGAPAAPVGRKGESVNLSTPLSIVLLLTVLSLAPAMLVLTTSFTRIVIVLSLLRQAIGTQALPPSQVIVGLSLFLTFLVMAPTFDRINREAITPLQANEIDQLTAWSRAKQPMRDFMFDQIEHSDNWADVYLMLNYRGIDTGRPDKLTRGDVDMLSLIPAFILSELKVAFLIAFRLYLPFLIIDMVVSSVLISMGMLMLPPVLVSLPFKLLLFVLVDGWTLVVGNLLNSFAVPGVTT
ncbi:MAG: flagellar type III secretion system pore protein FliP [Planctomycetes bacterium]|nr:flagellar type III secretion system pore protein FliP [Planctomycetota bacterium]